MSHRRKPVRDYPERAGTWQSKSMLDDPCFGEEALERAGQGALQSLRDQGQDPDEVIARAAANLEAWSKIPMDSPLRALTQRDYDFILNGC